MPANLNALIRYKTIDTCLSNRHRQWPIAELIEACSQALGEYRGVYKTVSERTIRDDLRVMRSDMLGFNAPIEFGEGSYYYADPSYSIFKVSVSDGELLGKILDLLLELRSEVSHPELEMIIEQVSRLVGIRGEGIAEETDMLDTMEDGLGAPLEMPSPESIDDRKVRSSRRIRLFNIRAKARRPRAGKKAVPDAFLWSGILELL